MSLPFIARENELNAIKQLIKAKKGAIYAVTGKAGIGKSSLLRHVSECYAKKVQLFIDVNDLPPAQTAVQLLKQFVETNSQLTETSKAITKINGTYKNKEALIAPYQDTLNNAVQVAVDNGVISSDSQDIKTAVFIWQELTGLWKIFSANRKENELKELGDPELLLLTALKKDCNKQPLILIDTYERLQAQHELQHQKISCHYAQLHQHLTLSKNSIPLKDWLDNFIEFLKNNGALVVIAGREITQWQQYAHALSQFNQSNIAELIRLSTFDNIKQLINVQDSREKILNILMQLSFNGMPLWLQLALNFVSLELARGNDLLSLTTNEIDKLFTDPENEIDLHSVNIERANCKLILFKRVMQHNLELTDSAWKMALPRQITKPVLTLLFAEQADQFRMVFSQAGLLPAMRWTNNTSVRLHAEIRDLLLAYANYYKWLDLQETRTLHQQLAELFKQHYQQTNDVFILLEQLYHQLMSSERFDLEKINDIDLLQNMAMSLETEQVYSKVIQVILRWLAIQDDDEIAWYCLGIALSHSGQLSEAIAAYQQALIINPQDEDSWNSLAIALDDLGQLSEAMAAYQQALVINPQDEDAWYNLGIILDNSGQLSEAIAAYQQALVINPRYEDAWYNLGIALDNSGQLSEAIAAYKQALAINPRYEDAWYNLGITLYNSGQLSEAIAAYQQALVINPRYEDAWYSLGVALDKSEQLSEAIAAYQQVLTINPQDEYIWYSLGVALSNSGQLKEAIEAYKKSLAINPQDENTWYNLGVDLDNSGQLNEAMAAYQQALTINPEFEQAWYNLGVDLDNSGQLSEAIAAYKKALAINPQNENTWNGLGAVLYNSGKISEAVEAYQQALAINPQDENIWYNLGYAYTKQGELDKAQNTYAQVLIINDKDISTLTNDAELALIQNDTERCQERINRAIALIDNDNELAVILPFLAWLAQPEQSCSAIYQAINQFNTEIEIEWDFTDIEPVILALTATQQITARQFIAYFQGTGVLPNEE